MVSSTVQTLLVIPALYALIKGWRLPHSEVVATEPQSPAVPRPDK
jgi:copper/silver efflux system protein